MDKCYYVGRFSTVKRRIKLETEEISDLLLELHGVADHYWRDIGLPDCSTQNALVVVCVNRNPHWTRHLGASITIITATEESHREYVL